MLRLFQLELPFFGAPPTGDTPRHIQLGSRVVDYRLVRARRRTLGMTIDQRGLRVGASPRTPLHEIERFLRLNAEWVLKKLDEWHAHAGVRHLFVRDGISIPVLGEACAVRVETGGNRFRWSDGLLILEAKPDADLCHVAKRALRSRALEVFSRQAAAHAARMQLPLPRLALSAAHTRWGSCSEATGIRLSWRLIHAAPRLIDYVVVHELAHLVEMNHSRRFWQVVERFFPDHRAAREDLKKFAISCPQLR